MRIFIHERLERKAVAPFKTKQIAELNKMLAYKSDPEYTIEFLNEFTDVKLNPLDETHFGVAKDLLLFNLNLN